MARCDVYWGRLESLCPHHALLLSAPESARRRAYLRDRDRDLFTLAASLLRVVAGMRAGVHPAEIEIDRTCPRCARPHGRPRVVNQRLEASISHSGEVVAVAVSSACPVGVDVELVRQFNYEPLIAEICAPEARHAVTSAEAFFMCWTRKEAVLKALGTGLTLPMAEVRLTPDADPLAVLSHPGEPSVTVQLRDASPARGYAGAVALLSATPVSVYTHHAAWLLAQVEP